METTTPVESVILVVGIVLGFLVFFCSLFFGIIYVLSRVGWAQLAEAYRSHLPFPGPQFTTFYTYIGWIKYGGLVRWGAGPQGLHMSCLWFQRWHPPLYRGAARRGLGPISATRTNPLASSRSGVMRWSLVVGGGCLRSGLTAEAER